jgi:hypothetical protein
MGECVNGFGVRGQGDKIDPDRTPKLALAAMMADRIFCVYGIQHKRVKELIAKREVQIETARILEDQHCGGYCFGRFSAGAPGLNGRRTESRRLAPGFHSACVKSGSRF